MVALEYQLAGAPETGMWTIRVQALTQIHEHQFYIEKYYLTFFEVWYPPTNINFALHPPRHQRVLSINFDSIHTLCVYKK